MNYWQISAGNGTIDLTDIFFKLNVALIGPGKYGDYFDNKSKYNELGRDGDLIKIFAKNVQIGDRFVLKHVKNPNLKTWNILAVGEVIGAYRYEPIFDAVTNEDWDIQHCRRVNWYVPKQEVIVEKGGAPIRIQKLNEDNPLKKKAEQLFDELL